MYEWKIGIDKLKNKIGSNSPLTKLKFNIKKIAETNHLPEYNISLEDDVVLFSRKELPKENNAPEQLPKHISKAEIEKNARPGESYEQVADRLKKLGAKPDSLDKSLERKKKLAEVKRKLL